MKLNERQLRSLIRSVVTEKFGAYDANDRYDVMYPHNFEAAAKEIYSTHVNAIVDEFVQGHLEMATAGYAPEDHDFWRTELSNMGAELGEKIMNLIAEYSDKTDI